MSRRPESLIDFRGLFENRSNAFQISKGAENAFLQRNLREKVGEHVVKRLHDRVREKEEKDFRERIQRRFRCENAFLFDMYTISGTSKEAFVQRLSNVQPIYLGRNYGSFDHYMSEFQDKFLDIKGSLNLRDKVLLVETCRSIIATNNLKKKFFELFRTQKFYFKLSDGLKCDCYCPLFEETCFTICFIYSIYRGEISLHATRHIGKIIVKRFRVILKSLENYIREREEAKLRFLEGKLVVSKKVANFFAFHRYDRTHQQPYHMMTSLFFYTLGFMLYHSRCAILLSMTAKCCLNYPLPAQYFLLKLLVSALKYFEEKDFDEEGVTIKALYHQLHLDEDKKENIPPMCLRIINECRICLVSMLTSPIKVSNLRIQNIQKTTNQKKLVSISSGARRPSCKYQSDSLTFKTSFTGLSSTISSWTSPLSSHSNSSSILEDEG